MENQQKSPQTTDTTRAGGKEPQPIPGQPTPDRQKPEIPEMPDKEVPEMPVRQTDTPTQAPVTSEANRQDANRQQEQKTPTPLQPERTTEPATEKEHLVEQERAIK